MESCYFDYFAIKWLSWPKCYYNSYAISRYPMCLYNLHIYFRAYINKEYKIGLKSGYFKACRTKQNDDPDQWSVGRHLIRRSDNLNNGSTSPIAAKNVGRNLRPAVEFSVLFTKNGCTSLFSAYYSNFLLSRINFWRKKIFI